MEFKSKISGDVDIYNINAFLKIEEEVDCNPRGTVTVEWTAELETRDWGIKGISAYATRITGSIFYDDAEEVEHELIVEDLIKDGTLKMESEIKVGDDGVTAVEYCVIDFSTKTITIS